MGPSFCCRGRLLTGHCWQPDFHSCFFAFPFLHIPFLHQCTLFEFSLAHIFCLFKISFLPFLRVSSSMQCIVTILLAHFFVCLKCRNKIHNFLFVGVQKKLVVSVSISAITNRTSYNCAKLRVSLADFPAVFFHICNFDIRQELQIQIPKDENKGQLSRAIY